MDDNDYGVGVGGIFTIVLLALLVIVGAMAGCPQWNVYNARLSGEAALAKANSTKQVLVTQAQAEKDAATLRAQAIEIVGKAAQEYPQYRQQEFIGAFAEALQDGKISQIIYVPTEANIPIIEAGRLAHESKK